MTFIAAGFVLGVAASVHCVVMCGPLMMAVLPRRNGRAATLYHGGRLITYAALGALIGAAGHLAGLAGASRLLSVVAGLALIWIAVRRAGWLKTNQQPGLGLGLGLRPGLGLGPRVTRIVVRATQAVRARFGESSPLRITSAGILNGLLPCGPVYAALTAAAALGDSRQSAAFMLAFGAGTLPALAFTGVIAAYLARVGRLVPLTPALSPHSGARGRHPLSPLRGEGRVRGTTRELTPRISGSGLSRLAAPAALAVIGVLLLMRGLTPPHHHDRATTPDHQPTKHHSHGDYGKRVASALVPAANGTSSRSE